MTKKMTKKDLINEYIGVIAIIVIVALAVVAIYFYVMRQPEHDIKEMNNVTISLNKKNTVDSEQSISL